MKYTIKNFVDMQSLTLQDDHFKGQKLIHMIADPAGCPMRFQFSMSEENARDLLDALESLLCATP
jgi:hypothetical protein